MTELPGPYPEQPSQSDFNREAVEAAAELVPFVGSSLARIVRGAWSNHLSDRQTDWFNSVNDALVSHAERIEGVEQKLQSDEFLTLYIRASQTATATHEAETRDALRNAVVNAALEKEEEDWSFIFVDLAGRLRPSHLQLLTFAAAPRSLLTEEQIAEVENYMMASLDVAVAMVFPDWTQDYANQIKVDLEADGLASMPGGSMSGRGVLAPRITDKGRRFLAFVTEPEL